MISILKGRFKGFWAAFARPEPIMNQGRTAFAQLMDELPKYQFDKCVGRYAGNKRMRTLPSYEHFLALAFAQLRLLRVQEAHVLAAD